MTSVPPALPGTAQNKRFKEKPRIYAPATWKGGHESMINRRHDGRASCLAWYSPKQALERKPRIYAPATWKGGHESEPARIDGTGRRSRFARIVLPDCEFALCVKFLN